MEISRSIAAIGMVAIFSVSGCASPERYQAQLDTWLGQAEADLLVVWGGPNAAIGTDDGGKIITYEYRTYGGTARNVSRWCDTTFLIKDGIVERYSFNGNSCG